MNSNGYIVRKKSLAPLPVAYTPSYEEHLFPMVAYKPTEAGLLVPTEVPLPPRVLLPLMPITWSEPTLAERMMKIGFVLPILALLMVGTYRHAPEGARLALASVGASVSRVALTSVATVGQAMNGDLVLSNLFPKLHFGTIHYSGKNKQ